MLPAGARLRRRDEFVATLRAGRARGGRPGARSPALLVAHVHDRHDRHDGPVAPSPQPARAGFVVSRAVGGAVVRNRVRRRLRHLVAARLGHLPPGSQLVVRALPASATASSPQLAAALDHALDPLLGRADRGTRQR